MGLHRGTIHRWLKTPDFKEAVSHSRAEFLRALREAPENLRTQAHATAAALLNDPTTSPKDRLRVALAILHRAA